MLICITIYYLLLTLRRPWGILYTLFCLDAVNIYWWWCINLCRVLEVCIYICVYMCVYIYIYIYIHIYIDVVILVVVYWGNTNRVVSNRVVSKGPLYPSKTKIVISFCFLIRPRLYASDGRCRAPGPPGPAPGSGSPPWAALLVSCYLSNTASFVLCVFCRVKDHHDLLHDSPLLKNTCVRQVVSSVRQVIPLTTSKNSPKCPAPPSPWRRLLVLLLSLSLSLSLSLLLAVVVVVVI